MRIATPFTYLVLILIALSTQALAEMKTGPTDKPVLNLKDKTVRINYSLGYQIGTDFKHQGVMLDAQAVIQGIEDALKGGRPQLSQPEMFTVLRDLKTRIVQQERKLKHDILIKNIAKDKEFLRKNKSMPDVKITASGLQYKIIKLGTGKYPKPSDNITVKYSGSLTNEQVFDSSKDRGSANFALKSVIRGWTEGLQLIKEGGKIKLFIPPELGYGERGPLAHRVLIFDIDLVSINSSTADK